MDTIIRKLTSRKFWAALVAFITGLLVYFGKTSEQAEQIAALVMSFGALIAYIIGEGMVDAAAAQNNTFYIGKTEDKPPEQDEF